MVGSLRIAIRGQWYFIPPQWGMQDKWEKVHFTRADFDLDRKDEFEIRNSSSTPVGITDVHAYMDKQFPSLRNVSFRLRNRTSRKVIGVSLRIGDESGAIYLAGPFEMKPKGYYALEESVPAYGDFCDGIMKNAIVIDEVDFADGSKWKLDVSGDRKDNLKVDF